jgi:3-oxoacyl-[acyl-carrier protein] reductase
MKIDLRGKRALVTGGGRGIGAAITRELAQAGAAVAVHFNANGSAAEEIRKGLPGKGHATIQVDLENPDQARALPALAAERLGGLDMVINNAGIYEPCSCIDTSPEDWLQNWNRCLAVNLTGPMQVICGAIPLLEAAGGGHVVNITSRGAYRGEPTTPAYGAAKAGLNSLTQSLTQLLGPRGIHLVAVAPGWVETDMSRDQLSSPEGDAIRGQSPLERVATPDEVAAVVLLAVSGQADALTGAVVDVNCGSYFR